jgi:hypothetical protein
MGEPGVVGKIILKWVLTGIENDVTTNHPGQPYWTLHFASPHSCVIPTTADAVMYS